MSRVEHSGAQRSNACAALAEVAALAAIASRVIVVAATSLPSTGTGFQHRAPAPAQSTMHNQWGAPTVTSSTFRPPDSE